MPALPIIGAIAAVGSLAYSVYSGEQQKEAQKQALAQQAAAQAESTRQYEAQAAASEQAVNAANQKQPDVGTIMGRAAEPGAASTMLTGPLGVGKEELQLGKKTLLGA